jgi:hypothetical protein
LLIASLSSLSELEPFPPYIGAIYAIFALPLPRNSPFHLSYEIIQQYLTIKGVGQPSLFLALAFCELGTVPDS